MGQYFYLINLDKKEYIHPFNLGGGVKLWEWLANYTVFLPIFLLRKSTESGGGDYHGEHLPNLGRWAGDRVALVGDYDESGLYDKAKKHFTEISHIIKQDFIKFLLWAELDVTTKNEKDLLHDLVELGMIDKKDALKFAIKDL